MLGEAATHESVHAAARTLRREEEARFRGGEDLAPRAEGALARGHVRIAAHLEAADPLEPPLPWPQRLVERVVAEARRAVLALRLERAPAQMEELGAVRAVVAVVVPREARRRP